MMNLSKLRCSLERATADDCGTIFDLESSSYPEDEAATLEGITMRQKCATKYFMVSRQRAVDGTVGLAGFINGTCILTDTIHHESMSEHQPTGNVLVIHSVTVAPHMRRMKLGSTMLKEYVQTLLKDSPEIHRILLLSKGYLLRFYQDCGFSLVGLSPVEHGKESWFEMSCDLTRLRHHVEQYQVDAFADRPFAGNPAAVVFAHKDVAWMQNLAAENNLAETAFVVVREGEDNAYDLRWFSPTSEVELCGHATLAAAHALWDSGRVARVHSDSSSSGGSGSSDSSSSTSSSSSSSGSSDSIRFHTLHSGILIATAKPGGMIELDFPSTPPTSVELSDAECADLRGALQIDGMNGVLYIGKTIYDLFVEVTPSAFEGMRVIDFGLLEKLTAKLGERGIGGRGIIVTTEGGNGFDFVSRCFFPLIGIPEDPVTGSAHCALAPYWCDKKSSRSLTGYQASKRGGIVRVALSSTAPQGDDSGPQERVLLSGPCITVIKANICV